MERPTVFLLRQGPGLHYAVVLFRMMREDVFTIANGDRENVPNYAIVISDGESNVDPEDTLPEAIESRIRGIHIIVVTVTKKPNLEMKGIASDPDDKNILYVENFSMLPDLVEVLIGGMCDGEKYTTWNKNIPHGIRISHME